MPDDLQVAYRPTEAARVLGISRAHVYRLIRSGDLRARKLGRSTLITRAELSAFVAKLPRVQSGDAA